MLKRPLTVPPSSDLNWLIWPCIRPSFETYFIIDEMNVPWILLRFLASTTSLANSCGCSCKNTLVNEGCPVSVLAYLIPNLSKAFESEAAAHNSTSMPAMSLICLSFCFSSLSSCCFVLSHFSRSIRTPRNVMSIKQGVSRVSRSKIVSRLSLLISTLKNL